MKPQPSIFLLSALAVAGGLLHGCEGGISQIAPGESIDNTLIAAYVDPKTPAPGAFDGDRLPILDGDPQDREWNAAQPLYVYVSGDKGNGGPGSYVELRALWSDDGKFTGGSNQVYLLVRYGDQTFDIFPDYWRYAREGALGLIPSPIPQGEGAQACDSVIVDGDNWFIENPGAQEDQICVMFEQEPASDDRGTYAELGCQVACHAGGGSNFGAVPQGKLDAWVWRAMRTNAVKSTNFPDFTQIDDASGRPNSAYTARYDPPTSWPAYSDDIYLDADGLHFDAGNPTYPFYSRTQGRAWTKNYFQAAGQDRPIPLLITEAIKKPERPGGSGSGTSEPVEPNNDALPSSLYLWGPKATRLGECDIVPTSRPGYDPVNPPRWSEKLTRGETDVMPGYALWIPSGSLADVRAKGSFKTNAQKRFPVWAVEFQRAFNTGFADDVQFDVTREYLFTVALFDKSSQLHSGSGPLKLKFQPGIFSAPARVATPKAEAGVVPPGSTPTGGLATAGKGGRS